MQISTRTDGCTIMNITHIDKEDQPQLLAIHFIMMQPFERRGPKYTGMYKSHQPMYLQLYRGLGMQGLINRSKNL